MMEQKVMKKYGWFGLIGFAVLILGGWLLFKPFAKPQPPPQFGFQALKIQGRFVSPEIFREEQNRFFMRWRRNAEMLRKTDEERNDLLLEEIINRVVLEDFLENQTEFSVTQQEVDDYINRYIKPRYTTTLDMNSFMASSGYKTEADLKKGIRLYLLRLKCFSKIAKERGVTIPKAEFEQKYQQQLKENPNGHPRAEYADMLLVEKFGTSDEFKTWIMEVRAPLSIEILDPALLAFRHSREGRHGEAGALYEKLYRERNFEIHLTRAIESYRLANNWKKLIQMGQMGMRKFPQKVSYDLYKAEGLYRSGKVKDALNLMKKAESRSKENVYFKGLILEMYTKLGLEQEAQRMKEKMKIN